MNPDCNSIFLTDRDRMDDLLSCEKFLIGGYSTFIPESSDMALRRVFTDNMQECAQDQFTVFDAMEKKGWYATKDAVPEDIDTARTQFGDLRSKIC